MISVKIIADSISPASVRLTTFELNYPRYIHAEVMTHRIFSRNAQSSRAVPVARSLEQEILSPLVWGQNQSGMSSDKELDELTQKECAYYWHAAARSCQDFSERMSKAGLHKQWANRPLEWFSPIKVVITATEWENFFWLRDDEEAAQPEIVLLARMMKSEMEASTPQLLQPGEWHLPYIGRKSFDDGSYIHVAGDVELELETAKKISASCCAQVSYRRLDTSVEKALAIYDRLFSGPKPHLSPVEHQATPVNPVLNDILPNTFQEGVTHIDRQWNYWSGNLRGWIQNRQLM